MSLKSIIAVYIILLSSCVMDRLDKHATIVNKSNNGLFVILTLNNQTVDDDWLYYGGGYPIPTDSTVDLYSGFVPDTTTLNFYIYSMDSVYKYKNNKKVDGIERQSFMRKISRVSAKLKSNDTLVIK